MINKQEKKRLKKIMGNHYTTRVLQVLQQRNVTALSGEPYTANMVRIVFNGQRESKEIEAAIFTVCALIKEETRREKLKRKDILKTA